MSIPTLVVGAAQSGAGKTTTTLALIAGLRRRGLRVQPFKVGPDYLDPSLLSWASDRQCRNLDGWMVPPDHLLELFHRACRGADVAVVEGVMGLFDGKSGSGDLASTASVARLLDASILLVLDAARASRTVGAVALGLARADPRLHVAGALLNRITSGRHLETCAEGLSALGIPLLGHLTKQRDLELPERYLGLVSPTENMPSPQLREDLERASADLDLDAILQLARPAAAAGESRLFPERAQPTRARVAYALDQAFHFYYRDSLDLIEAWGGELVPFSPLTDGSVPSRSAIYLGGGYPELFAAQLAANASLLASLREAHHRGALVYAECGGAMYASSGIETTEGERHGMLGLWPTWASLAQCRLTVGYRRVRSPSPHFLAGWELPAHEFHRSQLQGEGSSLPAWLVLDGRERPVGCSAPGLVASYIHLHLASRPGLARAFVEACQLPR